MTEEEKAETEKKLDLIGKILSLKMSVKETIHKSICNNSLVILEINVFLDDLLKEIMEKKDVKND